MFRTLSLNRTLNYDNTLPSDGITLVTHQIYLCRSYTILASLVIFTQTVNVSRAIFVWSRCMEVTGSWMEYTNEWAFNLKNFVSVP